MAKIYPETFFRFYPRFESFGSVQIGPVQLIGNSSSRFGSVKICVGRSLQKDLKKPLV